MSRGSSYNQGVIIDWDDLTTDDDTNQLQDSEGRDTPFFVFCTAGDILECITAKGRSHTYTAINGGWQPNLFLRVKTTGSTIAGDLYYGV
jgi:hypothetical protein